MCTKFTALEVGSGDAFLLEDYDNDWNCLFDAGGSKNRIVYLLKRKRIEELNLAICSHNDVDHANGFIGLLQSNIKIDEIWLPGTWSAILQYVKDNGFGLDEVKWVDKITRKCSKKNFEGLEYIKNKDCTNVLGVEAENLIDTESYLSLEEFNDTLFFFSEQIERGMIIKRIRGVQDYNYYNLRGEIGFSSLPLRLDKIIAIAGLAYRNGSKIRWFEPVDFCTCTKVDYGFAALNSYERIRMQRPKNACTFAILYMLTIENEYSLVFDYYNKDVPIIRFSADSDCTYQSVSPYSKNIIVTAPHHGSEANAIVYKELVGDNIIWVRSDRKSGKRPCCDFKCLNIKYCLACKKEKLKSEICFEYNASKNQWVYVKGVQCMCK